MDMFEAGYIVFCLLVTLALGVSAYKVGRRGFIITLGHGEMSDIVVEDYRTILRYQIIIAFIMMTVAGTVTLVVMILLIGKVLFFAPVEHATQLVGFATCVADSTLFGFLFRVWRECSARYRESVFMKSLMKEQR